MKTFGCVGTTIRLLGGGYMDLVYPQPGDIRLSDIAAALSKICRFGGQCAAFYSVAEHSWHCAKQAQRDGLPEDVQRAALLHDAAEAYIGDMVKPLKNLLPRFRDIEAKIEAAIAERFGVDFTAHKEAVRKIDREMLIAERKHLFSKDNKIWTGEYAVRQISVNFYEDQPFAAELRFGRLARQLQLLGEGDDL